MKKLILTLTILSLGILSNAQSKFKKVDNITADIVSCVAIHPLSKGYVAGTWGDGLTVVYLQNTYTFNASTPGFPTDNINDAVWLQDSIIIATDSGVVIISGENFDEISRLHTGNSDVPSNNVTCVDVSYLNGNTAIYVGTQDDGLGVLVGPFWINQSTLDGFPSNNIKDIIVGTDNIVYVATANAGVAYGNSLTSWEVFNISNSALGSNTIEGLAKTPQGNIWMGTGGFGGGVTMYDGTDMTTYNNGDAQLPSNLIYNMAFIDENTMALGTFAEGMVILDLATGKAAEHFTTQNSAIGDDFINDMQPSYDGTVWIATNNGLWLYNENGFVYQGGPAYFDEEYSIYPNPNVSGKLTIQLPAKNTAATINIYDVTGKLIMVEELGESYKDDINISQLKPGVYYATAIMLTGVETRKLIVE